MASSSSTAEEKYLSTLVAFLSAGDFSKGRLQVLQGELQDVLSTAHKTKAEIADIMAPIASILAAHVNAPAHTRVLPRKWEVPLGTLPNIEKQHTTSDARMYAMKQILSLAPTQEDDDDNEDEDASSNNISPPIAAVPLSPFETYALKEFNLEFVVPTFDDSDPDEVDRYESQMQYVTKLKSDFENDFKIANGIDIENSNPPKKPSKESMKQSEESMRRYNVAFAILAVLLETGVGKDQTTNALSELLAYSHIKLAAFATAMENHNARPSFPTKDEDFDRAHALYYLKECCGILGDFKKTITSPGDAGITLDYLTVLRAVEAGITTEYLGSWYVPSFLAEKRKKVPWIEMMFMLHFAQNAFNDAYTIAIYLRCVSGLKANPDATMRAELLVNYNFTLKTMCDMLKAPIVLNVASLIDTFGVLDAKVGNTTPRDTDEGLKAKKAKAEENAATLAKLEHQKKIVAILENGTKEFGFKFTLGKANFEDLNTMFTTLSDLQFDPASTAKLPLVEKARENLRILCHLVAIANLQSSNLLPPLYEESNAPAGAVYKFASAVVPTAIVNSASALVDAVGAFGSSAKSYWSGVKCVVGTTRNIMTEWASNDNQASVSARDKFKKATFSTILKDIIEWMSVSENLNLIVKLAEINPNNKTITFSVKSLVELMDAIKLATSLPKFWTYFNFITKKDGKSIKIKKLEYTNFRVIIAKELHKEKNLTPEVWLTDVFGLPDNNAIAAVEEPKVSVETHGDLVLYASLGITFSEPNPDTVKNLVERLNADSKFRLKFMALTYINNICAPVMSKDPTTGEVSKGPLRESPATWRFNDEIQSSEWTNERAFAIITLIKKTLGDSGSALSKQQEANVTMLLRFLADVTSGKLTSNENGNYIWFSMERDVPNNLARFIALVEALDEGALLNAKLLFSTIFGGKWLKITQDGKTSKNLMFSNATQWMTDMLDIFVSSKLNIILEYAVEDYDFPLDLPALFEPNIQFSTTPETSSAKKNQGKRRKRVKKNKGTSPVVAMDAAVKEEEESSTKDTEEEEEDVKNGLIPDSLNNLLLVFAKTTKKRVKLQYVDDSGQVNQDSLIFSEGKTFLEECFKRIDTEDEQCMHECTLLLKLLVEGVGTTGAKVDNTNIQWSNPFSSSAKFDFGYDPNATIMVPRSTRTLLSKDFPPEIDPHVVWIELLIRLLGGDVVDGLNAEKFGEILVDRKFGKSAKNPKIAGIAKLREQSLVSYTNFSAHIEGLPRGYTQQSFGELYPAEVLKQEHTDSRFIGDPVGGGGGSVISNVPRFQNAWQQNKFYELENMRNNIATLIKNKAAATTPAPSAASIPSVPPTDIAPSDIISIGGAYDSSDDD